MDEHTQLRLDALRRRVEHLEEHFARLHAHVGLGDMPQRPALSEHEVEPVKRLLQEGKEHEAMQLHRDLTGQGIEEAREALESLRAGL